MDFVAGCNVFFLSITNNIYYAEEATVNLAVINNKMDRYCGGLECGLHYFSESNLPACLRIERARDFFFNQLTIAGARRD